MLLETGQPSSSGWFFLPSRGKSVMPSFKGAPPLASACCASSSLGEGRSQSLFSDQQHKQNLGTCPKCTFSGTPTESETLGGGARCLTDPPGGPNARLNLRIARKHRASTLHSPSISRPGASGDNSCGKCEFPAEWFCVCGCCCFFITLVRNDSGLA